MSITEFHGTAVHGTTSVALSFPGGYTVTTGDLGIISVVSGESAEGTPDIPAGWTLLPSSTSGGGGSFGDGTGPRRVTAFGRIIQAGDSAPTVTFSGTTPSLSAVISCYQRTAGFAWGVETAAGSDSAAGTSFSAIMGRNLGIQAGDLMHMILAIRDDTSLSSPGISATGVTFGAVTERVDSSTTNGNDQTLYLSTATASSGDASSAATLTATIAASLTGAAMLVRVREAYRLYVQANEAPAVSPAFESWTTTTGAVRRKLTATKVATTETITTSWSGTANNNSLSFQAVSDPLEGAQTVSGWFYCMTRSRESNLDDNTNKRWRWVGVYSNDGSTLRGQCLSHSATGSGTEVATTYGGQIHADVASISSVSAQDGDRIVVEIGYGANVAGTTPTTDVEIGGNGWDHSTQGQADTFGSVGWIEFSGPLVFEASSVDATVAGVLVSITVASPNGVVSGAAVATGAVVNVTLAAPAGSVFVPSTTGGFLTEVNRLAGTTNLGLLAAANAYAGTTGLGLNAAFNAAAGNSAANARGLQGVLNQLAGTTDKGILAAIRSIP